MDASMMLQSSCDRAPHPASSRTNAFGAPDLLLLQQQRMMRLSSFTRRMHVWTIMCWMPWEVVIGGRGRVEHKEWEKKREEKARERFLSGRNDALFPVSKRHGKGSTPPCCCVLLCVAPPAHPHIDLLLGGGGRTPQLFVTATMTSSLLDRSQNNFMGSNSLLPGRRSRGGGGGGRRGGGIRRFGFRRGGGLLNYTGGSYGGAVQMTGPIHTQMKRSTARRYSFASAKFLQQQPATIPKWQPGIYQHVGNMGPATIKPLGIETGTKLYLSNLDYGVSTYDLKELFAEVGNLKRCSIHYDGNGCSKGTAEVVFAMKADAIAAMKQYNTVPLDGRPMHIELIGTNLSTSAVQATVPLARQTGLVVQAGARPTPSARRIVVMGAGSQWHGYSRGLRRGSAFRGRGRGWLADHGRRRVPLEEKSAEDLDAELETYRAEAMQI